MHRVEPIETVSRVDCVAKPSAKRVQCGVCGKTFCDGAVVTESLDETERDQIADVHGQPCAWRRLFCDHCVHVQNWIEVLDGASVPTGVVLLGPGYMRAAKDIAAFLKRHPEAAGVEQT